MEKAMKEDFIWNAGDALSTMRLYVEGALMLFENDALPLTKLAHVHQEWMAAEALDSIGEALYRVQDILCRLQQKRNTAIQHQAESSVKENI